MLQFEPVLRGFALSDSRTKNAKSFDDIVDGNFLAQFEIHLGQTPTLLTRLEAPTEASLGAESLQI